MLSGGLTNNSIELDACQQLLVSLMIQGAYESAKGR